MNEQRSRADQRAETSARIVAAAQEEFAAGGWAKATIRGIASRAGVDPALVMQRYGSKEKLFAAAVLPAVALDDADTTGHLAEVLETRMRGLPAATEALLRSAPTAPEAADALRGYLSERADGLVRAWRGDTEKPQKDDDELRAAMIVSSILGMTIARHLLGVDALARLDRDAVDRIAAPWFAALTPPDAVTAPVGATDQAAAEPPRRRRNAR